MLKGSKIYISGCSWMTQSDHERLKLQILPRFYEIYFTDILLTCTDVTIYQITCYVCITPNGLYSEKYLDGLEHLLNRTRQCNQYNIKATYCLVLLCICKDYPNSLAKPPAVLPVIPSEVQQEISPGIVPGNSSGNIAGFSKDFYQKYFMDFIGNSFIILSGASPEI